MRNDLDRHGAPGLRSRRANESRNDKRIDSGRPTLVTHRGYFIGVPQKNELVRLTVFLFWHSAYGHLQHFVTATYELFGAGKTRPVDFWPPHVNRREGFVRQSVWDSPSLSP